MSERHTNARRKAPSSTLAALLASGHDARATGDKEGAIAAFRSGTEFEPEAADPAFLLCAALLEASRPEAATLLDGLLTRFPGESAGWEEIGSVLSRAGQRDAALLCFKRASLNAPHPALLLRQGALLRDLGRREDAEAAFEAAVMLDPRSARGWFFLGLCRQDGRDHKGAIVAYQQALAHDPTLAEAAVNLGTALQEDGDLQGAKAAYGRAVATRPETFGRIAQAITAAPKGELWLDLEAFRRSLAP